ncbi:MAG: VRR-NUC domain-containing protein, partial [Aestuariibacter sp.]|nr:VRR-NUC domain-containing protein [Aestuariibacter sp.]
KNMVKEMNEHQHQTALINWARNNERDFPELALLHAIPNGGKRGKKVAMDMKAEGLKPGVPDLCLPVARMGYHGMYIEMKTRTGRVSRVQDQSIGFQS